MPASDTWKYVENQFEAETQGSYKKMLAIVTDADGKLKTATAPDLVVLYNDLHLVCTAYTTAYNQWQAAQGLSIGATQGLAQQLRLLSSKLARQWDIVVLGIYDKGTPEHTAIFPSGREKLQTGSDDDILAEVAALALRLKPYLGNAALATLQGQIKTFHGQLTTLLDTKNAKSGEIPTLSSTLEAARKQAATVLYGNLGALMKKYQATPMSITGFYDLKLLRQKSKDKPSDIQPTTPVV